MTRLQRLTAMLLASTLGLVFAQGAAVRVDGSEPERFRKAIADWP